MSWRMTANGAKLPGAPSKPRNLQATPEWRDACASGLEDPKGFWNEAEVLGIQCLKHVENTHTHIQPLRAKNLDDYRNYRT